MRDSGTSLIPRAIRLTILGAAVVAACSTTIPPSAPASDSTRSNSVSTLPSTTPTALSTSTALPTATALPTLIPPCGRQGSAAFPGVVDAPPDGWFDQGEIATLHGFATTYGRVYGPDGIAVPPREGPSRLALYETVPANNAYFKSRIEQSRKHHGKPIDVTVCDEATEAWLTKSTGELIVGWTDRDKSDVLVANTADFTVQQLVDTAERVYDCCG
jgi:hypothetical protein